MSLDNFTKVLCLDVEWKFASKILQVIENQEAGAVTTIVTKFCACQRWGF